jgi:hypothetical protein
MFTAKRSIIVFSLCVITSVIGYLNPFGWIARSHVEGNVPAEEAEFDRLLTLGLRDFFVSHLNRSDIEVKSRLLRKGATQSGVASPKFYAWISVTDNAGQVLTTGAARIAAMDRSRFDVTDFLDAKSIVSHPSAIARIFPKVLVGKIIHEANVSVEAH